MATKVKTGVIDSSAITSALIANASITADDLHTTLDLTGKTVTVATASAGDNDTSVASTAFVSTAIANLADSAPSTLNTLNELAAALGDDASFSTTVTNSIATKLPLAGGTLTGALTTNGVVNTGTSHNFALNTPNSLRINIDSNNSATDQIFVIGHNQTSVDNNNALMTILESGHVGIGTSSPATELQIGDYSDNLESITIATASDQTGRINFYNANASEGASLRVTGGGQGAKMMFANRYNTDSDKVTFDLVNGRVGIGTVNPSAHLHVNATNPTIKLGSYSFITEDVGDLDSLGLWTHTTESILFGQTSNNLTSNNITCRIDNNGILRPTRFRIPASALPTSALSAGDMHMDTGDSNTLKVYNGTQWLDISSTSVTASGGVTATYGGYKSHTFTGSGTFTVTTGGAIDVMLVAGGGGGSQDTAGGGGAGGMLVSQSVNITAQSYSIVIGAGGAQANSTRGYPGNDTTGFGLTAIAGGGGAGSAGGSTNGGNGGSGGGGGGGKTGGSGTSGQGFGGETSSGGAGGGGAGEAGGTDGVGYGGDGLQNNYKTGSNIYYAGGGGGRSGSTGYPGGDGGGGNGPSGNSGLGAGNSAYAGTANTGGGGAAYSGAWGGAGPGGSGIVVIRYPV